jgi:tRNA nucleotidyltransferase (CCA-adding enzyme)
LLILGYNIFMHVILTHEQADFDAIGALLGAALMNERAVPVLPRKTNRNVRAFLNLYGAELPFIEARDLPGESIEQVTLVDTQSLITLKGLNNDTHIHVVDHHQERPDLPPGWTMTGERVGACTTLLVENLREPNGGLGIIPATLLLLGIYEDTGSLTYISTTPRDVRAAAYLLESGASLRIANEYLNSPLSSEQRLVYDRLLKSAQSYQIAGRTILIACVAAEEMTEEISSVAHKLRDLLDPDALFLLIGTIEGVRLVARSTSDQINVAQVAAHFGGGGHERAAAALIHMPPSFPVPEGVSPLEAVHQELLRLLTEVVKPSVTVDQIMSRRPNLLKPHTSLQAAALLMQRYGYEGFPVVQDGKVIGLLTRRAVDRALSHKLNLTVASLMEAGEVSVAPRDDIETLQKIMTASGWGQVPVVDPETHEVVGIVTRTDLLKTLSGDEGKVPGRLNLAVRLDSALPPAHLGLLKAIAGQAHDMKMAIYMVGGFGRDLLLERPSLDFDVVVEGDAIALAGRLVERYGGRMVAHSRFGTAKWRIGDIRSSLVSQLSIVKTVISDELPESLDLISARTEFYEYPTALPTVERSSIKLDLHRRDFTINTMAIRLDGRHYGELYDYWGGLSDLRQGLVRVLHSLSFVDDPTRMLRAVRFEQRFGFRIEARTLQLMSEATDLVRQLSGQRLCHELDLILAEEKAVPMLGRLNELGLLAAIHPDMPWSEEIGRRLSQVMESPPDPGWSLPAKASHMPTWQALAYLAWLGGLPPERAVLAADRLCLSAALQQALKDVCTLQNELVDLVGKPPSQAVKRLEGVPVLALCALQCFNLPFPASQVITHYLEDWQHIHSSIDGEALIRYGVTPGPVFKKVLNALRAAWLDGKVNSVEEEQALLKELLHNFLKAENLIK